MPRAKRGVKRTQKRPMVKRKKGVVATPPPRTVLTRKEAIALGELTLNPPAPTKAAIASLRKARRYPTKENVTADRGTGTGPLPGRDVTVVQTGKKTLFVRKQKDPDAPRGDDPLILCKRCKVWSARKAYCSNCKEERK